MSSGPICTKRGLYTTQKNHYKNAFSNLLHRHIYLVYFLTIKHIFKYFLTISQHFYKF